MGTPNSVVAKCCTLTRKWWIVGCVLEWVHGMVFGRELGRVFEDGALVGRE